MEEGVSPGAAGVPPTVGVLLFSASEGVLTSHLRENTWFEGWCQGMFTDNDFKEIYYGDICFPLVFQYFQTVTTLLKTREKVVNSEVSRVRHLMDQ